MSVDQLVDRLLEIRGAVVGPGDIAVAEVDHDREGCPIVLSGDGLGSLQDVANAVQGVGVEVLAGRVGGGRLRQLHADDRALPSVFVGKVVATGEVHDVGPVRDAPRYRSKPAIAELNSGAAIEAFLVDNSAVGVRREENVDLALVDLPAVGHRVDGLLTLGLPCVAFPAGSVLDPKILDPRLLLLQAKPLVSKRDAVVDHPDDDGAGVGFSVGRLEAREGILRRPGHRDRLRIDRRQDGDPRNGAVAVQ